MARELIPDRVRLALDMTIPAPTPTEPPESRSSQRWIYSFVPNKIGAGSTVSLPPLFITEVLGGSIAAVGIASSVTSTAAVPAAVLWGWLSDRFGSRRLYLALGFLGFGIPTLLMAFAQDTGQYLLLTALVGALSIAGAPVSSTLIMDTTPKERWTDAFGRFNQVSGWGLVAGRLVGLGWITYLTLSMGNVAAQRSLWVVSGALSILAAAAVLWLTPRLGRTKPRRPLRLVMLLTVGRSVAAAAAGVHLAAACIAQRFGRKPDLARFPEEVRQRSLALAHEPLVTYYVATFVLFTASVLTYTPFAVFQRQQLGSSTSIVFFMGLVNSLAAAVTYRYAGKASGRTGGLTVQITAVAMRVIAFAGFALISWIGLSDLKADIALIALQTISGFSWAGIAVAGSTTVARLAPKGNEGTAVGTYNAFLSLGSIAGAFASGYLAQWAGYTVVFAAGAVGMAITALLLVWVRRAAVSRHSYPV